MPTKDEQEIVLPPLPPFSTAPVADRQTVQDYARAAVRLDRERRAEPKPWPQGGDKCYLLSSGGVIHEITYTVVYAFELDRGNIFRTRVEARAKDERDLVMAEWERAADWKEDDKWYPVLGHGWFADWAGRKIGQPFPVFATRESCEAFIKRMSKPDGTSRLDCLARGKP